VRLKLLRGGKDFFTLFEAMADKVDEGARELLALLKNFDRVKERVQWVLDIRHEGDEITHEIVREINTTFVAPLDSEDIYRLASTCWTTCWTRSKQRPSASPCFASPGRCRRC
jgi:uncharacterized protein Yka (UPF0111/DUF47 family)